MATPIRELLVFLGVDAKDSDKQISSVEKGLKAVATAGAAAVGAVAAVAAGLFALANSAAVAGDAVAKAASRTATGVEEYQRLEFAAEQSAVSAGALEKALGKQVDALTQLEKGTGPAVDGLNELGISAEEYASLSQEDRLELIAEKLSGVTDEQERLRLAQQIYGKSLGSELMPLLEAGADGISAMGDQAEELGLVMSEEDAAAATKFGDTLDQVWRIVDSLWRTIGLSLLPILTEWLEGARDWVAANREVIDTNLDAWLGVLIEVLDAAGNLVMWFGEMAVTAFGGVENALIALGVAAAAAGAALLAWFSPVVAVVAAVAAPFILLALVIEDLIVFINGGDSAIGRFINNFRESEGLIGSVARNLERLIGIGMTVFSVLQMLGQMSYQLLSVTLLPLLQIAGAAFMWLGGILGGILGSVLEFFLQGIVGAVNAVAAAVEFVLGIIQPLIDAMTSMLDLASDVTGLDLGPGGEEGSAPLASLAGVEEGPDAGAFGVAGVTGEEGTTAAPEMAGFELSPFPGPPAEPGAPVADPGAPVTDPTLGAMPPPVPPPAPTSADFAPSPVEVAGPAALAPAPAPGATGEGAAPMTVTVEGSTLEFSNVGFDEPGIRRLFEEFMASQSRGLGAVLGGAEL